MTTITWSIQWLQTSTQPIDGYSQVVLTAGWSCVGNDFVATSTPFVAGTNGNYYSANVSNSCSFPLPASGGSFTPFDQLTQEQVLGWVWANGVNKDATEAAIQANIDNQITPPVETPPLPWAGA